MDCLDPSLTSRSAASRFTNVLCVENESPHYDRRVWQETVDSIVELNGAKADGRELNRKDLKVGDKIKYIDRGEGSSATEWKGIIKS